MKSRSFEWPARVASAILLLMVLFAGWIPFGAQAATTYHVDVSLSPDFSFNAQVQPGSGEYSGPTTFTASYEGCKWCDDYFFAYWTINGVSGNTDNPLTIDISATTTLVANFTVGVPRFVSVEANPNDGGSVSPGDNYYGTWGWWSRGPSFMATPAPGYTFVNWTINGVTGNSSNPLNMNTAEATTLAANFTSGPTKAVDPAVLLDRAYGGWTTGINIRNASSSLGAVEASYCDSSGNAVSSDLRALGGNGSSGLYQGGRLGENWAGSAVISSTVPVVAAVNEVGPGDRAMGYNSTVQPSNTIYLPLVMDDGYGGWTTGVSIKNSSALSATVTIDYYNQDGSKVKTEVGVVEAKGSWGVYQGGKFGGNWVGSAIVTSTQPVVAVVNEINSDGRAIAYNGFSSVGTSVYLPIILKNGYGGWTTGITVQNASPSEVFAEIRYYDENGSAVYRPSEPHLPVSDWLGLNGHGSAGLYTGNNSDLPDNFVGTAILIANQPVTAIVNETKVGSDAMGYNGVLQGQTEVDIPVVLDNAYGGWTTGMTILNTANPNYNPVQADVSVTYYDQNGLVIGSASKTLGGGASWALYQGGALGGRAASARITSTQPVAVIVNEIGPGGAAISYNGTE